MWVYENMRGDDELLREYVNERSEAAFAALAERHLGLVHAAALRQVDGDTGLAQDVAQLVFIDLARKAPRLMHHASLSGWLYTSVRYAAASVRRSLRRRLHHEREAQAMSDLPDDSVSEADWARLRPVLDEAMHALRERDRHAVLLRYFEGKSLAEVGRVLGLEEDAAGKRVRRALEKLRLWLQRRGVALPTTVLAAALGGPTVTAAPAGLSALVTSASLAGAGASAAIPFGSLLIMTKTKIVLTVLVGGAVAGLWMQHQAGTRLREANQSLSRLDAEGDALRAENDRLRNALPTDRNPATEQELARLRAQADALNQRVANAAQQKGATSAAPPAQEPAAAERARVSRANLIHVVATGEALMAYVDAHKGQFPTNTLDLSSYMAEELEHAIGSGQAITNVDELASVLPSLRTNYGLDRFELLYQGRMKDLGKTPPEGVVVMREREARLQPDGTWERTYFNGFGNARVEVSTDRDFSAWEARRLPKAAGQP